MKVYILGASGYLGGLLSTHWKGSTVYEVVAERIDITDFRALQEAFARVKPDVVINFAGVKAYPTIDWCEDHKEETVAVNVGGAINVMLASLEVGAYPIQIASGCVYSGDTSHYFTEEDEPNFYGSFYSRMRIALQNILAELPVLYVRIRMPMSTTSHPRNFINKIVSYAKVISIPNSVTLLEDLWPALERLIEIRATGVLNLTNEGYVTHDQVLRMYTEVVNPNHTYEQISLEQLEGPGGITKAKRSNCVLATEKMKNLGIQMPALDADKLREVFVAYKKTIA